MDATAVINADSYDANDVLMACQGPRNTQPSQSARAGKAAQAVPSVVRVEGFGQTMIVEAPDGRRFNVHLPLAWRLPGLQRARRSRTRAIAVPGEDMSPGCWLRCPVSRG